MDIQKQSGAVGKDSICAQAALLGDMLAQSIEYRKYYEAKRKLQVDQEHAYILSRLREQQKGLHLARILGINLDEEEDRFEQLYATFCLEPVVCDFLYAEGRLGMLISEVQKICKDKLELWSENDDAGRAVEQELN
ncbi:MAG: YlbF family regulator [Clostridiales bacterium]|nr:YlbF family regulator [Clostridiales bacterium]